MAGLVSRLYVIFTLAVSFASAAKFRRGLPYDEFIWSPMKTSNGKTYWYLLNYDYNFDNSQKACSHIDSHLIFLETEQEERDLKQALSQNDYDFEFWLGTVRYGSTWYWEGQYDRWPVTWSNWEDTDHRFDCATGYVQGGWYDSDPFTKHGVICEDWTSTRGSADDVTREETLGNLLVSTDNEITSQISPTPVTTTSNSLTNTTKEIESIEVDQIGDHGSLTDKEVPVSTEDCPAGHCYKIVTDGHYWLLNTLEKLTSLECAITCTRIHDCKAFVSPERGHACILLRSTGLQHPTVDCNQMLCYVRFP